MDRWPEFVIDGEASAARPRAEQNLTGWETVVFDVEDQDGSSDFSTAALAP
jgi:sarcosine oxidase delta subunit